MKQVSCDGNYTAGTEQNETIFPSGCAKPKHSKYLINF